MNKSKRLEIFEILEVFAKTKSKADKIALLREHNIMALRDVLQGTFDPAIQWNLPEGKPPYIENANHNAPSTLLRQHRYFKYFVKGVHESEKLTRIKREKMFIELLEAVHPEDSKILLAMVSKKSPVKGLTLKIVTEALPDLISK